MVPKIRFQSRNTAPVRRDGEFVLYWMIAFRRTEWNYSLQRAVEWAVDLGRPLVIFEPLRIGYRWASDRLHQFVIDGIGDNAEGGRLSPGNSTGILNVGNVSFVGPASELFVEIGGTAPGSGYDRLVVTGTASLAGQLLVGLVDFTPASTDVFTILTAGTISGGFANVVAGRVATVDGMGSFLVTVDTVNDQVVLSDFAVPSPVLGGDYNEDGRVNAADYVVWRNRVGQSVSLPGENPAATTPNFVDQEDYDFWKVNFGNTQPASAGGSGAWASKSTDSRGVEPRESEPTPAMPQVRAEPPSALSGDAVFVADGQDAGELPLLKAQRRTQITSHSRDVALIAWLALRAAGPFADVESDEFDNSNSDPWECDSTNIPTCTLDLAFTTWPRVAAAIEC